MEGWERSGIVTTRGFRFGELRQRSVNGRDSFVDLAVTAVGDGYVTETVESLELKRVLGNDSIRE